VLGRADETSISMRLLGWRSRKEAAIHPVAQGPKEHVREGAELSGDAGGPYSIPGRGLLGGTRRLERPVLRTGSLVTTEACVVGISFEDVTFRYRDEPAPAISGLTDSLLSGGIVVLLGRSGIGKSTLLRLAAGVYVKEDPWIGCLDGRIQLKNEDPRDVIGPSRVCLMSQRTALLDHLSAEENLLLPLEIDRVRVRSETRLRGDYLMDKLSVRAYKDKRPRELSGGMRTRVALGRALLLQPEFLFLDEPMASLDMVRRWDMYKTLGDERKRSGLTTVLSTHDILEALVLGDDIRVVGLQDGKTVLRVVDVDVDGIDLDEMKMKDVLEAVAPYVDDVAVVMNDMSEGFPG
jgi:ABC-type nitrate/sulfonate/bicarbonate transport system ATPase subunit